MRFGLPMSRHKSFKEFGVMDKAEEVQALHGWKAKEIHRKKATKKKKRLFVVVILLCGALLLLLLLYYNTTIITILN